MLFFEGIFFGLYLIEYDLSLIFFIELVQDLGFSYIELVSILIFAFD